MSDPAATNGEASSPDAATPPWYKSRAVRWLGFIAAIGLLVASVVMALQEGRSGGGFERLAEADPVNVAALLAMVLITTVCVNGLMFWLVHLPFFDRDRPCGPVAMMGLLAASALLNYTPVKAGLVGRVAYLKHRHGVSYSASVLVHMILSGAILGALVVVLITTLWRRDLDAVWSVATVVGWGLIAFIGAVLLHYVPPRKIADWAGREKLGGVGRTFALIAGATLLAGANMLGIAVRWWLVGKTLAIELAMVDAVFISLIHTLTGAAPANGLGMREWLNKAGTEAGLLGKSMHASVLTVSLVDRAAEVIVVLVSGLVSLAWLGKFRKEIAGEIHEEMSDV